MRNRTPTDSRKKEISEWIDRSLELNLTASLVQGNKNWCTFVFDQQDDKFGGFGVAGIFSDEVNALRVFVERSPEWRVTSFSPFICITIEPSRT